MSFSFFAAAATAIAAGMHGAMYPAPSQLHTSRYACSGGHTPRKLFLEGPLNGGEPCPVEKLLRGTRKTRRQRKKEKAQ